MEQPKHELKVKYKTISSFTFANLMQKLGASPVENKYASHIAQIKKRCNKAMDQIRKEFDLEITQVYAKRDEKGAIVRPEDEPQGFEPMEDKLEAFKKAQEDFSEREAIIDYKPLTPTTLKEIKMTADEIEALGDLYDEAAAPGPGMPLQFPNGVANRPRANA